MSLSYGLIQSVDLRHPRLPPALDGFRIAHLSDTHLPVGHRPAERALSQLARLRIDLLALTGDYMDRRANHHKAVAAARDFLDQLAHTLRPKHGAFGVFGNHDHPDLINPLLQHPNDSPITWLHNTPAPPNLDLPLQLAGLSELGRAPADAPHLALQLTTTDKPAQSTSPAAPVHSAANPPTRQPANLNQSPIQKPFSLFLLHRPTNVIQAAALGADLALAGHSHGGQIRAPWGQPFYNSSDLPLAATAGLMRHRDTLLAVTRGLGRSRFTPRLNCPPHLPVYTLRRGPLPTTDPQQIACFQPW